MLQLLTKIYPGALFTKMRVALFLLVLGLSVLAAGTSATVYAAQCGSKENAVKTSIDIGCRGASCVSSNPHGCSALVDAIFAIMRLLSAGVGIVIVGSLMFAGVQYASARDDPSAVGKAKDRIRNNIIALGLFIFGYAILNYLIPAGFFQ
jgi:hypothetical protein